MNPYTFKHLSPQGQEEFRRYFAESRINLLAKSENGFELGFSQEGESNFIEHLECAIWALTESSLTTEWAHKAAVVMAACIAALVLTRDPAWSPSAVSYYRLARKFATTSIRVSWQIDREMASMPIYVGWAVKIVQKKLNAP